jgi:acetyl esterase/lipase
VTEFPVLIPTTAGVVGAIVTSPDDPPGAAAVILHGAGSTRAGTNQVWVGVARAFAEIGVVTLRLDYPELGESHAAQRLECVAEALQWFRDRTAELDVLVVGVCFGVLPGAEFAFGDSRVRSFAAMTPPLFPAPDAVPPPRASLRRRLAHRSRRLPKRLFLWVRYGVRQPRRPPLSITMADSPDIMRELTRRVPVWVLTGEDDTMTPTVRVMAPELEASGSCRVEIVAGALYSYPTPGSQEVQHERTLEWARSALAEELSA